MIPSMRGRCSSDGLVMPPLSLTRWVIELRLLAWEVGNGYSSLNSALSAMKLTNLLVAAVSTVTHAVQPMRNAVTSAGTERTSKKGETKKGKTITTGEVVHPLNTIKRSPTTVTGKCVRFVEKRLPLSTTRTKTGTIATWRIYNRYVNAVTKCTSTIVLVIYRNSVLNQRYSQNPQQCGTDSLNYGKAANRLSIDLGYLDKVREEHPDWNDRRCKWLAKQMAQDLIDKYFDQIPGARDFIQGTYRIAADTKYVETYLGRRRYLPDLMDWDEQMEELAAAQAKGRDLCWCTQCKQSRDADRETVNTILQGTAADIILLAMIRCDTDQELKELECRLLLQVHDELLFECPEGNVARAMEIIQYHMEHPGVRLKVPLRAEPGYGDNWAEAKN